jgi:hypothetical protein
MHDESQWPGRSRLPPWFDAGATRSTVRGYHGHVICLRISVVMREQPYADWDDVHHPCMFEIDRAHLESRVLVNTKI